MAIHFKCQCGKGFKVDESFGGKRTKCPACGAVVSIPKSGASASPAVKPQFRLAEETPSAASDNSLALEAETLGPGGKTGETRAAPPPTPPAASQAAKVRKDEAELGLEEESLGVGGKMPSEAAPPPPATPKPPPVAKPPPAQADAALDLGLEVETLGPGGKTGPTPAAATPEPVKPPDSTRDEIPIELPLEAPPAPPTAPPPSAGPALAPEAAPPAPQAPPRVAEGRKCPKCGAAATAKAAICLECGAPISGAAPAKATPAKGKLPDRLRDLAEDAIEWVRKHKVPAIAAGAVLVLGLGAGGFFLWKMKSAAPVAPPAVAAAPVGMPPSGDAPAAPAAPAATTTTTLSPQWERQFRDPTLNARRDLEDYRRAWTVAGGKAVEAAQVPATVKVLPDPGGPPRVRPVAWVSADARRSQVLFSDGGIRLMFEADRALLEVRGGPGGLLNAADEALLRRLTPKLEVVNSRLTALDVVVDGRPVGRAAPDSPLTVELTPGKHEVILAAGEIRSEAISVEAAPGVVERLFLPRQQDLPWLAIRNYRVALQALAVSVGSQPPPYAIERTGNTITSLRSAVERVVFTNPIARNAIAPDGRSIEARIEREEATLAGLDDKTLHVGETGRLEEGAVLYKNGAKVLYRRTAIGPVGRQSLPDLGLAEFGRMRGGASSVAGLGTPAAPAPAAPGAPADGARGVSTRLERLTAYPEVYLPNPDSDAIGKPLKDSTAVTLLLARMGAGAARSAAAPPAAPPVPAAPAASGGEARRPALPTGASYAAAQAVGLLPPAPDAVIGALPPERALAMLAILRDPAALAPVLRQLEGMDPKTEGYAEALLAVARCGRATAMLPIRSAVEKSRLHAIVAFALIDDPAARQALPGIVAGLTARDAVEAIAAWPGLGGPASRRAFAQALLTANPALMEDADALNALIRFEPCALEAALLARLTASLKAPESPTPAPTDKAGETAPDLKDGAPLSWLVLARLQSVEAIAAYAALLKDKDPLRRHAALQALSEAPDPALVGLVASLLRDPGAPTRCAAALFLARVGDAAAVKALAEGMTRELALRSICVATPTLVRRAGPQPTAELLVKMLVATSESAPAETPGAPAQPPPSAGPYEPAGSEAILAAMEAARLRPEGLPEAAMKKLAASPDGRVRGAVLIWTLASGSADATPTVEAGLKDAAVAVRRAAIDGIRTLPPPARAPLFALAAKDAEPEVRAAAMSAAVRGGLDAAAVRSVLSAGLDDASPGVVRAAARAARAQGAPALGDAACAALNKQAAPTPETVPATIELINAAVALRAPNAAGTLMMLLASPEAEVRAAAASGLGRLRAANAVAALATALQDKEPAVAVAALAALGELGTPQAAQAALIALQQQKDLPPLLRRKILVGALSRSSADASWAARIPLADTDLTVLAEVAAGASPAWRTPLAVVARRYVADSRPELRRPAGLILAALADDPEMRKLLMDSWERDAAGLGEAVADVFRRSRDPQALDAELLRRYRQLAEAAARWPGLTKGTPEEAQAVRLALIEAAGKTGGDEAARVLRNMLAADSRAEVLPALIAALAESDSALGVQYLSDLAAPQSSARADGLTPAIIEAIARAGQTHREKAIEALARLTRNHMPPEVSAAALDAMARLGALPAARSAEGAESRTRP